MYIGSAINYRYLMDSPDDTKYLEIVSTEFDILVAENGCKGYAISKAKDFGLDLLGSFLASGADKYQNDYSECHYINNFAKKYGAHHRGHVLVWANGETTAPRVVQEMTDTAEVEKYMLSYIE
tara:strand:+ start:160 stop:528 length:369 start_codon:yes stop_codon:yes gene_type:complete